MRLLLLLPLLLLPLNVRADSWDFVVAPYLMVPSISGDASLGKIDGADVEVSGEDILSSLEFGGMLQVEAHHESGFGMSLNYAFMNLGENIEGPRGESEFETDIFQGSLEAYGMYRSKLETSVLDVYAGVRWWDMNIDVDATTPFGARTLRNNEDWVDPVVGVRWAPGIAKDWRLLLQGDIGGFGVASDFSWNVQVGALWDMSEMSSLVLMYRVLSVDYETGARGAKDYFAYDTVTYGPILGAVFRL